MANTIISGQIGSGKTYYCIEKFLLPALKSNRHVYTNIDMGDEKGLEFLAQCRFSIYLKKDVRELLYVKPFEELRELLILNDMEGLSLRVQKGSVIIIDEAQMIFDYLSVNSVDKRIYHLFAYARHFGLDLIFITQSPELLNKFILKLCNQFLLISGKKQISTLAKNVYHVEYSNTQDGILLAKSISRYNVEIFSLYRSYVSSSDDIFKQYLPQGALKIIVMVVITATLFYMAMVKFHSGSLLFKI